MTTLSLLPIAVNLQVPRSVVTPFDLEFTDINGDAINIGGDTITITVRDEYGGTVQFDEDAVITDAAGGLATVTLTAADTTDAKSAGTTTWVYVITRTHAGVVVPWWGGNFQICETAYQVGSP